MCEFLHAATILKAHGVQGLVYVRNLLENPKRLFEMDLFLEENPFHVQFQSFKSSRMLCKIENVVTRTQAQYYLGKKIFALKNAVLLPSDLEDDEFFYHDLLHASILYKQNIIGHVQKIHNFGACDILEIETLANTEYESFMIPFTKQNIPHMIKINPTHYHLYLDPPPNLLIRK